jgi:hypothetical protein
VTLQRAHGSSWVSIGSARTDARSDYRIRTRVPLTGSEKLRAVLTASDGSQVVSKTVALAGVHPVISVAGVAWVFTGGVLHATGAFRPARPGRTVVLQRKAGARWVTLAKGRLDKHSRYAMNAKVGLPPGSVAVRVVAEPFAGAPAAASPTHVVAVADTPPALTGPMDEVYLALAHGSTPGSYTTVAGTPALAFVDAGLVTAAVPPQGPAEVAAGALDPTATVSTGIYDAHDGRVDLSWPSTGVSTTLRPDAHGLLRLDGRTYGVVDPLDGATLSGTYRRLSGGSGATVTFTGHGRFSDEGVTADTDLPSTANPSGAGAYRVAGNTLTMVYDAGPLQTLSLYALPQYLGSKDRLVIGGQTFVRTKS